MHPQPPRLRITEALTDADRAACLALRCAAFRGGRGSDADRHDDAARHLMVWDGAGLAATLRHRRLTARQAARDSYGAGFYDLDRLAAYPRPLIEIGRLCLRPGSAEAAVLRVIWGALAAEVDATGAGMLFGCTSLPAEPVPHAGLAWLAAHARPPADWAPGRRAPETLPLRPARVEPRAALAQIPPLLRSYVGLGGWVSDHAVIDRDLGTLHVFTAVEVAAIPPARARALRALASGPVRDTDRGPSATHRPDVRQPS